MKVSGNSVKNVLDTHPRLKDMIMESSTDISMAWHVFLKVDHQGYVKLLITFFLSAIMLTYKENTPAI